MIMRPETKSRYLMFLACQPDMSSIFERPKYIIKTTAIIEPQLSSEEQISGCKAKANDFVDFGGNIANGLRTEKVSQFYSA